MAVLNVLSLILVVTVNALANILEIGGISTGERSDMYENLFAPAGLTFSIWGLIYFLLIGFTIYLAVPQLIGKDRNNDLLQRISIWFIASNVLNSAWVFAWHYNWIGTSLLLILGVFAAVAVIYLNLQSFSTKTLSEKIFIRVPFQVYFGWLTVAVIANITTYLVYAGWNGFGIPDSLWMLVVIAAAVIIGLRMLALYVDLPYIGVLVWALLGIIIKRASTEPQEWLVIAIAAAAIITLVYFAAVRGEKKYPSVTG